MDGRTNDIRERSSSTSARRAIPGMEGVRLRPPRPLYEPTWTERAFPWFYDFLIELDLDRLERAFARAQDRMDVAFGTVCVPLEPVILGLGGLFSGAASAVAGGLGRVVSFLPLPGVVRRWLWIGPQPALAAGDPTTQSQMKDRFDSMLWLGVIASTVCHIGLFTLWPELEAGAFSVSSSELVAIEIPPEIEIPPPPEQIARPATPVVVAAAQLDEDITIAPTTFEQNPVGELPPPPREAVQRVRATPTLTPYTIRPRVLNPEEVSDLIRAEYPPMLRDAGIGGEVVISFFIDRTGTVQETRLFESSGRDDLDAAALRVADRFAFSPAMEGDQPVEVWIQMPVVLRSR